MGTDLAIPPKGCALRKLIDKVSAKISQLGGRKFEQVLKDGYEKKKGGSVIFNFFEEDNIYHQYYLLRVQCLGEGIGEEETEAYIKMQMEAGVGMDVKMIEEREKEKGEDNPEESKKEIDDMEEEKEEKEQKKKREECEDQEIRGETKEGKENKVGPMIVTMVSQKKGARGSAIDYALLRYSQLEQKSKMEQEQKEKQEQEQKQELEQEQEGQGEEEKERDTGGEHDDPFSKFRQIKPYERYLDRRWLLGEPDDCSVYQIELMKVTAMYTACSGETFLNAIREKEDRNPDFNFLSTRSIYSKYFTSLVDAYRCILLSPKPTKSFAYQFVMEEKKELKAKGKRKGSLSKRSEKEGERENGQTSGEGEGKDPITNDTLSTESKTLTRRSDIDGNERERQTRLETKTEFNIYGPGATTTEEADTEKQIDSTTNATSATNKTSTNHSTNNNNNTKLGIHEAIMFKLGHDQFPADVFEGIVHSYEYQRLKQEAKQQLEQNQKSEKEMFDQVDWQDFDVVATLDIDRNDLGLDDSESESDSEEEEEEEEEGEGEGEGEKGKKEVDDEKEGDRMVIGKEVEREEEEKEDMVIEGEKKKERILPSNLMESKVEKQEKKTKKKKKKKDRSMESDSEEEDEEEEEEEEEEGE